MRSAVARPRPDAAPVTNAMREARVAAAMATGEGGTTTVNAGSGVGFCCSCCGATRIFIISSKLHKCAKPCLAVARINHRSTTRTQFGVWTSSSVLWVLLTLLNGVREKAGTRRLHPL